MATLKIRDLSVGDWVMCNEDKYRVMGITMFHELDLLKSSESFRTSIDNIEPIPITAEILEKNGFEKYSEREWECNDDSPYHTFIHIDTPDETMWFISFPTIFNLTWDHPIYNIHQLQHLIRLAGVDKEINL